MSETAPQHEVKDSSALPWVTNIGIKVVELTPMTAQMAGQYLDRPINTANADKDCDGYLVKGVADDGYLVRYKDGYLSWSPKGVADEAYRPINEQPPYLELLAEAVHKASSENEG